MPCTWHTISQRCCPVSCTLSSQLKISSRILLHILPECQAGEHPFDERERLDTISSHWHKDVAIWQLMLDPSSDESMVIPDLHRCTSRNHLRGRLVCFALIVVQMEAS